MIIFVPGVTRERKDKNPAGAMTIIPQEQYFSVPELNLFGGRTDDAYPPG